eukprot:1248017-Ditylum_brightwellii.AAC.1
MHCTMNSYIFSCHKTIVADENNNDTISNNAISNKDNNCCIKDENTVRLMTAASMRTLRTTSQSAGEIYLDASVTARIPNLRTAGADAERC